MMKMKNIEKIACIAFIALFVGMSIASVGQKPDHPGDPFTWTIVWSVFVFMAVPATLGYLAGRKDGKGS
jgi:hypothetical protein